MKVVYFEYLQIIFFDFSKMICMDERRKKVYKYFFNTFYREFQ